MATVSPNRCPKFLALGFDWYILEKWQSNTAETKHDQHIRLGLEYAHLGHRGRRSYIQNANAYAANPAQATHSRPIFEVPQDLLSPQERTLSASSGPVWFRTINSIGTDDIHADLFDGLRNVNHFGPGKDENYILDNPTRYTVSSEKDGKNLEGLLAYVPGLVDMTADSFQKQQVYLQSDASTQLIGVPKDIGSPEDSQKEFSMRANQRSFYVADAEALVSGFILWVHIDEFGRIAQRNRVRVIDLAAFTKLIKRGASLAEMGVGYEDGRVDWHYGGIDGSVD